MVCDGSSVDKARINTNFQIAQSPSQANSGCWGLLRLSLIDGMHLNVLAQKLISPLDPCAQVFDVIALRVVVAGNKHDCYYAQRCIQELYRCMPGRSKDFIRGIKKANG